eukprot:TRINITY_DN12263_c0_g1_i1.p1 TRINITY_DN12263_c0_g1~~TRINITY_DN12263_c0_g1_i1.p1  ORF type:complete len:223 (-),score=10.65 TRINITY_DN12263_c0_g1_i1:66-713(-)
MNDARASINTKLILVSVLVLFCVLLYYTNIQDLRDYIHSLGWYGVIVFIFVHSTMVVLCFVGSISLELTAGYTYGPLWGTLIVLVSKFCGGTISFILGKTLLNDWVVQVVKQYPTFLSLQEQMKGDVWKLALAMRLSPIPSWIVNYGLSITPLPLEHFMLATIICSLPTVTQNVLIGSNFNDLTSGEWNIKTGLSMALSTLMILSSLFIPKYVVF